MPTLAMCNLHIDCYLQAIITDFSCAEHSTNDWLTCKFCTII